MTTPTTNNAKLVFANHDETLLDVRHFSIHDEMSGLFEASVVAVSSDDDIDLSSIVGLGAAIRLQRDDGQGGVHVRVWSGVCANMTQLSAEPAPSVSTYHVTIVPTLWRTTLRRNSRIYQHLSTPDIVVKLLSEWQIAPVLELRQAYKQHEYCVQYGETDYAFFCRLLEDAGISFYFRQTSASGMGNDIIQLVLSDAPQANVQWSGTLPYVGTAPQAFTAIPDFCSSVTLTQRVKPGRFRVRDFDFRFGTPSTPLLQDHVTNGPENIYEQYDYGPGSFWWEPGQAGGTPVADANGVARTDMQQAQLLLDRQARAERRRRLVVSFQTNVLKLGPGHVVGINQNSTTTAAHPRPDLAADKKLLVTESHVEGENSGDWTMTTSCVFAEYVYRPERRTPRPRIFGVQSAIVVGPAGSEIYTDEFGRVRVQFHWDREGSYDDNSSCWMRVSQAWAGGAFGLINIPRIGHEVLVEFFEGNPDTPVIVGRVFNSTTTVPYPLPQNQTQSGWKSNSLPGGGGYNELMFDDAAGNELIRMQAQKDLSYVVNENVTGNIGSARTTNIGATDTLNVGGVRTTSVGAVDDTLNVGALRTTLVGTADTLSVGAQRVTVVGMVDQTMVGGAHKVYVGAAPLQIGQEIKSDGTIVISNGKSSIKLQDGSIFINATDEIHLHAGSHIHLSVTTGDILIKGGPLVDINNPNTKVVTVQVDKVGSAIAPTAPSPPSPAAPGSPGTPPYIPSGGGSIPAPGAVTDVDVPPGDAVTTE